MTGSSDGTPHPPEGFPPCPGCNSTGHSIQEWVGEEQVQMWHCNNDDCRVQQYRPRECDPQEKPGGAFL